MEDDDEKYNDLSTRPPQIYIASPRHFLRALACARPKEGQLQMKMTFP